MHKDKMSTNYWYWYIQNCVVTALILFALIAVMIRSIDPIVLIRLGWIGPLCLWYGIRQVKKERDKAEKEQTKD